MILEFFLTQYHHYLPLNPFHHGVISPPPQGQVLYGNTLTDHTGVPHNLKEQVGEFYKARFGKDISEQTVIDISQSQTSPNYPMQSDSVMCGISVLSIIVSSTINY